MSDFPAVHSPVKHTPGGIPYLERPGVVMVSRPAVNLSGIQGFLDGFDASLGFQRYLVDDDIDLGPAEQLCKFAGQLCYLSLGAKRTMNRDAKKYFDNIKSSGHGSVLEHANFTFLFYGISRSVTHELVRHRAGFGFSQVSQRYVSGRVLRFVMKAEYQQNESLRQIAMSRFERMAAEYEADVQVFMQMQSTGATLMTGEQKTDLRKKVQQAAREFLGNTVEAPIVVTANVRSWRHFCEMRASGHAEVSIRALAMRTFECLARSAPVLFDDYSVMKYADGTLGLDTSYRKV